MSTLTDEQRQYIERDGHVHIENGAYVVVKADVYERARLTVERKQEIKRQGYVRIENGAYVVVKADTFEQAREIMDQTSRPVQDNKLAILLTLLTLGIFRFYAVPQGYWRMVTAFGKFVRVSKPGLAGCLSLWGFYKKPGGLIPSMEQVRNYAGETVFTKDGVECVIDAVVFFRIDEALKAIFGVQNYEDAVKALVQAILRNECGNLSARELLASRRKLAEELRIQLERDSQPWGITVRLVEITGIQIMTDKARGT